MQRVFVRWSLVALAVTILNGAGASAEPPVRQEGTGTIRGQLIWGGNDVPKLAPLVEKGDGSKKDANVCAAETLLDRSLVIDPESKGVRYAFVYLPSPVGTNDEKVAQLLEEHPEVEIDQINCEFLPYSTPILEGQKVIFKSSDPVAHNVRYQGFTNAAQNIQLPPNGQFEAKLVAERRPMPLKCDIHPWMSGWIMVFSNPFFAVTDEQGNFEIRGVPEGDQNIVIWQERVGYVTPNAAKGLTVPVKAGMVTTVGPVKIEPSSVRDLPSASAN